MPERTLDARADLAVPVPAVPGFRAAPAKRPRVLVVEDEAPIARDIANVLQNAGFEPVGPAAGPARALELVSCDAAVLDIRLGRRTSEAVALALRERGTPFIAVSAYSRTECRRASATRLFSISRSSQNCRSGILGAVSQVKGPSTANIAIAAAAPSLVTPEAARGYPESWKLPRCRVRRERLSGMTFCAPMPPRDGRAPER